MKIDVRLERIKLFLNEQRQYLDEKGKEIVYNQLVYNQEYIIGYN